MNVHHYSSRAAAAIAAAVLLVCTSTPAEAASTANTASASQTVGSGTWGAVATLRSAAPYGTGTLTLSFTNQGSSDNPSFKPQYFTVVNTGTLPMTKASYSGTTSAPSSVQFLVDSCSGTWNEATGACQGGTPARVLAPQSGSFPYSVTSTTVPASAKTSIRLRATVVVNDNISTTPTLTVNVAVDRTQIRAATTTGG